MLGREFLIRICRNPFTEGLGIYFGYEDSQGFKVAKPVKLEYEKVDDSAMETKPTLLIPHGLASKFLKAALKAIEREGIKSKSTATMEGLLEATKYHLEDMRKIIFDNPKRRNR